MKTSTRTAVVSLLAAGLVAAAAADAEAQESAPESREERAESPEISIAPGHVVRSRPDGGHLGVAIEDLDREGAEEAGLSRVRGVRVTDVRDGSPAAEAGLREGDVLVRFDGRDVRSARQLVRLVRETPPGRQAEVELSRDGDRRTVEVRVGERPGGWPGLSEERMEKIHEQIEGAMDRHGDAMERLKELRGDLDVEVHGTPHGVSGDRGRLGVRLQRLTDQLADHFGVEDGGALVASVREGSPAADAGLRAGDVIVRVGDRDVDGPGDAARAVRRNEAGPVTVELVRDGERRTVTVELPERPDGGEETGLSPRRASPPRSPAAGGFRHPAVPSGPEGVPGPAPSATPVPPEPAPPGPARVPTPPGPPAAVGHPGV